MRSSMANPLTGISMGALLRHSGTETAAVVTHEGAVWTVRAHGLSAQGLTLAQATDRLAALLPFYVEVTYRVVLTTRKRSVEARLPAFLVTEEARGQMVAQFENLLFDTLPPNSPDAAPRTLARAIVARVLPAVGTPV